MDSEILTLQVDINDDPMNQKVDAIEQRLSTLQKDAKKMAEDTVPSTESLPGYNEAFMRKLANWDRSLTDIGRTRSAMEHAMSSYEREGLSEAYKRKVEIANRSIKDLSNSQNLVQELLGVLGPGMSKVFTQGLTGIVSQLSSGIRTTAASISSEVSRKLTDDEIVDRFMRSDKYSKIAQKLGQQNPEVFSAQNMRKYLMANVPMSVPQYMRQAITGGSQVQLRKQAESYRDMLPKSFQKIEPYAEPRHARQLGQNKHASETLSADEISALGRIVRNNRYAADAAVKAGVISKSGQKMYFNHATNHDMMDAMAGYLMDDMTVAAQGERKYGIRNVTDRNVWKNIRNKIGSNKTLDGALAAARAMDDAFGSWLSPGRFNTKFGQFDPNGGNAEYIGRITHSPRKTSRAFAEYSLDMMQQGAQISGMHPIVMDERTGKWTELTKVNGPRKATAKDRAITPDDFHTISMNDSMLQKMVMATPSASRVGQNGFSDNMFYLKFEKELGDPRLSKERRAELAKQYGDLFAQGYDVNGQHYINTRISKTHAEFMKESIVDEIGRKAMGYSYDQKLSPEDAAKARQAGLNVLSNGGGIGHFDTFKPFAKSMYNQNNMATEGESLSTWLGTRFGFTGNKETARMLAQSGLTEEQRQHIMEEHGTPNMKVVVGSFGKADMDGSNWISDRISSQGFQGRTFGGKATYVPINMMDMRAKNYKQVEMTEEAQKRVEEINAKAQQDIEEANRTLSGKKLARRLSGIESNRAKSEAYAVAQLGGDWVIPNAGIGGEALRVSKDTDVIEDINNIKHYKTVLQPEFDAKIKEIEESNASNAEKQAQIRATTAEFQQRMNEARSRDYSRDEIFAKTTYDDANTSSRWLSKQLINSSMNAGFRDPRVQRYFDKQFFDELDRMSDDQYVRDTLFKGDQSVNLQSEEAQKTINDHIAGMWARYNEGDRLLPTGVFKYAMAAPNPQSVINNRLMAAGIALTPEQQALQLGDNQVISMESLNKQLGIARFPATKTGNVTVDNVFAEDLIKSGGATRQQIERIARSSGIVDTKGLYFAPNSPILKLLQGEDFDGDLNAYFGLSDNMSPKDAEAFSEVMRIVANASDKEVEELWHAKPGTPEFRKAWEEQEARKAARTTESTPKAGGYNILDPYDKAAYLVNVPREHAMMGAAERSADMAALYYGGLNDPRMRDNIAQAIKDYESQYDVVSTNMKTDESWRRTDAQAYAADRGLSFSRMFKYANDAVETTGENDESVRIWNAKSKKALEDKNVDQLGLPSLFQGSIMGTLMGRMRSRQQGIDPEGGVYKWGDVLDAVALPEGVSANSEQGKFVQMMRGVRKDFLESKYLVASNQTVDALQAQYEKAVDEIEKSVSPTAEGRALKKERLAAIGAQAFDNFKQFGATERNLASASWTRKSLEDYAKENGTTVEALIGHTDFVSPNQQPVVAQKPAANATVTVVEKLPAEAQAPFEQKARKTAEEMLAQETPQQQAERILKEAGMGTRQINKVLDANVRDTLVAAIAGNDMAALQSIPGVGAKTAATAMQALQGASILGVRTTPTSEMNKPITSVQAAQIAEQVVSKESENKSQTSEEAPRKAEPETNAYGNSAPSWGGGNPPPGGPPNNPPSGGPGGPPSGGNSWDAQAAQAYYGQLMSSAQEFSGKLFGDIINYEQRNKDIPKSIINANRNDAIAARYEQQIKDFMASDDYKYLTEDQKKNMQNLISPQHGLISKAGRDFSEMSMYSSGQLVESIGQAEQKATGAYDSQLEALQKWDEKIKEVTADQQRLLEMSKDPKYSKDLQDQFKKSADKVGEDLSKITTSRQNIGNAMQTQNQEAFNKQIENLENRLHPGSRYDQMSRQYQQQIEGVRENLTKKHDAGLISDSAFNSDMQRLADLEKQTSSTALSMQQGFKAVGTSITRSVQNIAMRFGRQLFQKALTEAKKFVVEYNRTMTEIQMITLKTDDQMKDLGDGLVSKAKELKISVAEVTKSAATLYRQGLTDEEVNERLDVISKFSKVSGTKVDAATKLITVAMNTGLVSDPQVAADIVTALGDNAATNAAEIERGIEKAGAAASADGTTFAQLASMLTAITSTTQIGGSTAGRTLNTIFGRMNKIGTNELIYDENGNAISGSAVAKLLEAQGINQYENGVKKSSYDTLYELSQKWDKMSDAEQQQIATAIAGTRQYSNFSAIMQGMAEGKVDQYISLAGESAGITDKKYEIYVKSLDASLTNLKNTFDELVKDLTSNGAITGVVDTLSSMVQGVDNLTKSMGPLGAALTTVLPLLLGLTALRVGLSTGSMPVIAAGLGVAAAGGIIAGIAGNAGPSAAERNQEYDENYRTRVAKYDGLDRLKELRNNPNRTDAENEEYASLINKFAQTLGLTNDAAGSAAYSVETLSGAIKRLSKGADDAADKVIKEADEQEKKEFAANIANTRGDTIDELESGAKEKRSELDKTLSLGNRWFNGKVWDYDTTTGQYKLKENALKNQQSWVQAGMGNDRLFGLQGAVNGWIGGNTVSYNKDLEDPLVDFYYNAAQAGRMGDHERTTTREQWSNRLKNGMVTQEQLEAAFEYMDRSSAVNDTGFESKRSQAKEILSRKLGLFYNEDQIDFLANKMAQDWHSNGSATNAYNNIVGTGSTYEEISEAVNNSLSGYVPKGTIRKMPYDLQDVGTNGYYVDETGKQWTADEVQAYYDSQNASNRNNAIAIMQEHNASIKADHDAEVARVEAENAAEEARVEAENAARTAAYESDVAAEARRMYRWDDSLYSHHGEEGYVEGRPAAERAYYEDLWMQEALKSYSPELAKSIWEGKDENLKNRAISNIAWDHPFSNLSPEEQDKYLSQYGDMWDELSPEKQAEWIAKAREAIASPELLQAELQSIPELDKDQLIGGVEATAAALGELYDQGEVLPEVADKISAANEKSAQAQHKFEAVVNHFLDDAAAAYESEQGFGTKNKAAISADNLTRLLLSGQFGTGAEGAAAFMSYLNENTEAAGDWLTLIQSSPDLQNVASQVYRDQKTGQIIAPDDIMGQLLHTIQGSSLTYGASYLTPAERGAIAQRAYSGLTGEGWFVSQQSKNAAQEEAWLAYQEDVLNTYNARKAEIEASKAPNGVKRAELASLEDEYGTRFTTKEAFIRSRDDLMAGAMSAEQANYLKAVLGDQMYARVLEARSGGKALTQSEKDYAALVLGNNANGLTSLTAGQQLKGIKDVRAAIKNGTFERDAAADQYMSQWSDWSEYAALLSKRQAGTLSPEDAQRMSVLEASLNNFEQNAEIKLEVEGVKQLEEAGEVAEGTAAKIEKLRKGGKVQVDVEMQIHNEAFESGQKRARLFNGNETEQDEAAMALLGMSREEYFGDRDTNLAKAQQIDRETYQGVDADTWMQLYKSEKTAEGRQIIRDAAAKAGFVLSRDSSNQAFEYVGSPLVNINPLTGTARAYSDAEKNTMLDRILAGEQRTTGPNGNSQLYDAALDVAGENTRELLRRQNENRLAGREENYGIEPSLLLASQQERSSYRNSTLSGYSTKMSQAQQAQWALSNPTNTSSADYISSLLGMNEKDVQKMLGSSEGKTELASQVKDSQKALYSEMAKNLAGIELDQEDMSSWKEQLQEAANGATGYMKEFLQWMADTVTEGGEILADAGNKTFSEVIADSQQGEVAKQAALANVNTYIQNGNYADILKDKSVDYSQLDQALLYMLNDRAVNGEASAFSTEMINNAYQNELLGRESAPQTQQAVLSHLFGGNLSSENMVSTYQTWMKNPTTYAAQLSTFNGLEGIGDVKESVSSETNAIDKTTEAMKKYNQEMGVKALQYAKAFGDQTDDITSSLLNLAKGGKTAAKELASLNRKAYDTQDAMTAWDEAFNGGKVKSGKQMSKGGKKAISDYLGISESEVAKWTSDEMAQLFANDSVKQSINTDMDNVVESLLNDAMSDIQAKVGNIEDWTEPIDIGGTVAVVCNPDGDINMDGLIALANAAQSDAVGVLEALAQGKLAEWIATLKTSGSGDSFRAWIDAVTTTNAKRSSGGGRSYNNRGGGGGGGGGKSAADKAIEEADYRVTEAKHKVTMAQTAQEHYAFTNNYQSEIDSIYEEVSAQKGLAEVYEENLASLRAQQAAVQQYSEDWWKLEKQILSTEEALAETNNAIEALSQKEIAVVQRKQDNEDAPYRFKRSMIDSYVERYETQYQSGGRMTEDKAYKAWEKQKLKQTESIQQELAQNKVQMAEWQALLATLDKNTQSYKDVQQKIWDMQKENAELENQLLQQEIELNNARLERIAKTLQNKMGRSEHEINMSDTQGQIYQIRRDYGGYRAELAKQRSQYKNETSYYAKALEQAKQQMNSLTEGSAAWYQARDAVYEYEEALKKLELTQEEINQAIRESYLSEAFEKIEQIDTKNQQNMTAAQTQTQRAKLIGDDAAYIKGLEKEEKALIKQAEAEQKNLAILMELKNSGKIKKGTKEWDELLQKIKDVQNQVNQTENDVLAKANEVAAARLEKIMSDYEDRTKDTQHQFNMIQYQETYYKANGELTNYGTALQAEQKNRQELLKQQRKTRTELLKELDRYGVGSDQYNNVLAQIQKIEEEIAKTENAINSTGNAIKENEEAIRKVKMTLENTLNNEMKKRIQEEKEQLSATVNLQKSILDTIKKRYQEEWRLIKQDLEKKKKALQEEKSLIQERMKARREAEQTEDKQSQLTELQKQLAIIEADPTRTKEAKELRKQIEDLQKEISNNLADNIANAEQKRLDDIITGISDYVSNHEQDLNEYLKDNTNFQEILDNVLSGAEEDYIKYMQENDETYKNATAEQKKLMEQGWHDTWLKMRGDVENYWQEVLHYTDINEENQAQIREEFIEYMKQGSEYQNASATRQMSLVYEWGKTFDNYIASMKKDENAGKPETTDTGEGGNNAVTDTKIKALFEDLKNSTLKTSIDGKVTLDDNYGAALSAIANTLTGTNRYIKGGIVDYTGIAKVDGTPGRPEAFLNATDTANVRAMVDQLNYAKTHPVISQVPAGSFVNNEVNVGDVYVTINEAEISSDQDIDVLARKVGQSFTRQLSRNGFNTANYAF